MPMPVSSAMKMNTGDRARVAVSVRSCAFHVVYDDAELSDMSACDGALGGEFLRIMPSGIVQYTPRVGTLKLQQESAR